MHRIDSKGSRNGRFVFREEGTSSRDEIETLITAKWLNELQDELVNLVVLSGMALEKGNSKQILGSLRRMFSPQLPVGSIVASFLDEISFQKQMGNSWILSDGRNVSESKFATLTGMNHVPDLRGKFLRGVGGLSSDLGQAQDSSTSTKDLKASLVNASAHVRGSSKSGKSDLRAFVSGPKNLGVWTLGDSALRGGDRNAVTWGGGRQDGLQDIGHSHEVDLVGSVVGEVGLEGASETRPENVAVNFFVRID